jgi:3-methyladenine DNA glycosylase/8-oxoguanine DNA glycosylase
LSTIIKTEDFNLDHTLDCGQVFRWQRNNGGWIGVVGGHIVRARQEAEALIVDSDLSRDRIIHYFRLDDDMQDIYSQINRGPYHGRADPAFPWTPADQAGTLGMPHLLHGVQL